MGRDVLLFTRNIQEAREEIAALGGQVTQQFTDTVIVANLPDSVAPQFLKKSTPNRPSSLDQISQLAVEAWNGLQNKTTRAAPLPTEGLGWDAPGYTPPGYLKNNPSANTIIGRSPARSTGTPTSLYMTGSVAVGVVIVSGTQANLSLSSTEQQKIIQEVQEGLTFLSNAEPRAKLSFVYDIRLITVSVAPGSTSDYELAEAPWRNAALQQMGFPANSSGSVQYVQNLKQSKGTNWAYVGYFTKYPLHWFAYAGGERVVMHYDNDGWGPDSINAVFAHETCHIFGAADEYGSCACGGSHGYLGIPNNNCKNCPGSHEACLMDANTLQICQWSRKQIGWDEKLFPPTKLAQAMWIHGHSMQIEVPDNLARTWRAGFYIEVEGKPNGDNWFHFAIPSKVIVNDQRLRVGSVMLLCETLSTDAVIRDVHIYDGPDKIAVHNNVNLSGNLGFQRFDVLSHPPFKWGIGISVGVHFGGGSGSRVMRFKSAGCDFVL